MEFLDSSLSESDSPNTRDWKKYRVATGQVTDEERAFLIRNGLLELGEDGEYREMSTIIDSEGDTDEEEENVEPKEQLNGVGSPGNLAGASTSVLNKSVDESLGSLNPSRASKKRDSHTRVLSPLVTNSSPGLKSDSFISGILKPNLLSPFGPESNESTPTSKCNQSSAASPLINSPELVFAQEEITPTKSAPSEVSTNTTDVNIHIVSATPDRGMDTLPFAFATPTPGRDGIDSISAPTPEASFTPGTPTESGKFQTIALTPAAVAENGEPREDQSLASIQCPSTYSSPADFSSPLNPNVSRLAGSTLFQTPISYLSPASRKKLNKTVELMDISFGDVADEFAASSSDVSGRDDSNVSMDHPREILEQHIEVPSNVQIIDEILDLKGTEETLFVGRLESNTEESSKEIVPNQRDSISQCVDATEKSRQVDILIIEHKEPINVAAGIGLEDEFGEEYITSATDTKGIDAMSPASVAEDISLNNTSDSLADISLDDISNGSFKLSDEDEENEKVGPNESFRTCSSAVSSCSFASCHEVEDDNRVEEARSSCEPVNEDVKSFEDLDDTMTMVEKLLLQADELEAMENNNQLLQKSPVSFILQPTTPGTARNEHHRVFENLSPSIFATPKTPIKNKGGNGVIFATPAGPAPKAKPALDPSYFSPMSKPALPPTPPRLATPGRSNNASPKRLTPSSSPSPKSAPPKKLNNILDSPVRKVPVVHGTGNSGSPHRAMRTPVKVAAVGHPPISSPVANYIYSVPPPVHVKKMIPAPKMPSVLSPKSKGLDSRIPRPKQSMPVPSDMPCESDVAIKKPGRETICDLFPQPKAGKEIAQQVHYIGSDTVKSVNGNIATPSKLPTVKMGNTPVFGSSKHLGMRDLNNASMVAQQPAIRKFCPERVTKQ